MLFEADTPSERHRQADRHEQADQDREGPRDDAGATSVFALREAVARTAEAFARRRTDSEKSIWDAVVLTASNPSQAAAYRRELEHRRHLGLLPSDCRLVVNPDPSGPRVGSGGATLLALEAALREWARAGEAQSPDAPLAGRRVLVIHSGGDSQRMPVYGAIGKIFTPLPLALPQSATSTIFDWLYILASGLPSLPGEVVVLSGDVMLLFDPGRLGPRGADVRGVGIHAPVDVGTRHGVFAVGEGGRLRRFLHKLDEADLRVAGAVDPGGRVLLDSGIVVLGERAIGNLLRLAGLRAGERGVERTGDGLLLAGGGCRPFDLYHEWMSCLGEDAAGGAESPIRSALDTAGPAAGVPGLARDAARGLSAEVAAPEPAAFVHLGTHREYHQTIARPSVLRAVFPLAAVRDSRVATGARSTEALICRSIVGPEVELGRGVVLDHCRAEGRLVVEEGSLVSGVFVPGGRALRVPAGRVCYETVVQGRSSPRVAVILGLDDNPKAALGEPGATCQGEPWETWLADRGIAADDLWSDGAPRTLWEARLFVADADDPDREIFGWLAEARGALERARDAWLRADRYSLRRLRDAADCLSLLAWRADLQEDVAVGRVLDDVAAFGDEDFHDLLTSLPPDGRRRVLARLVRAVPAAAEPLHRARILRLLASLSATYLDGERAGDDSAAPPTAPAVAEGLARRVELEGRGLPTVWLQDHSVGEVKAAVLASPAGVVAATPALRTGTLVRVSAPVRIDFGGGWTDTPPFSLERGGAVVNAALSLDGSLPIQASVEVLPEPRVLVEAEDLGYAAELRDAAELGRLSDVLDPLLLHKASLVLAGLLAPGCGTLANQLERLGGGLLVRTSCRLPRGSGLGTSSILGAALLRALDEVKGQVPSDGELSQQTLALEQLMTTGGGWQDQMGAIAPGLKLVSTEPGPDQRPRVETLALSPEQVATLDSHLVVAYTGHHRVAKNILREVVLRHLGRDPVAMQALYQLKALARQLAQALARLDLPLVGILVNQAWLLNKTLDPQTSYPALERLFRALAPHVYGLKLVGAGGGGFLLAVGKSPETRDVVAEALASDREFSHGYVVESALWQRGLTVEVQR